MWGVDIMNLIGPIYVVTGLYHPLTVNAGFIYTDDGVIVVDSSWTVHSARTIMGYIKALSDNVMIKYLIWTEHHSDHIFGSIVFRNAGAKIISHEFAEKFLNEIGGITGYLEYIKRRLDSLYPGYKDTGLDISTTIFHGVEDVWPDITIKKETVLKIGNIELILIPAPGHTPSNIIVYLPDFKTVFAGDTVYSGFPPNTRFSTPDLIKKWIDILDKMLSMDIDYVVPGHGPICGLDEVHRNLIELEKHT